MDEIITIAVITYNGIEVLPLCLESIFSQTYRHFRLVVVNNASTDGTRDWLARHYPELPVLDMPSNGGPNPARNSAIMGSGSRLVLLVDDDAVLEPECLEALFEAVRTHPDGAVWSPRIVYHDEPNRIQFEGVFLHYTCEAILLNPEKPLANGVDQITPIHIAGGVSYLLDREKALRIGLFDEDFFFGRTDGEFTFRLSIAGYHLYTVPNAVCHHRVKIRGLTKFYYQVRNRWDMILKCYSGRTLLLIAPALAAYEVALVAYILKHGRVNEYFQAIRTIIKDRRRILEKRRDVQAGRQVPDKDLLFADDMNIRKDLIQKRLEAYMKRLMDRFFSLYWQFIFVWL